MDKDKKPHRDSTSQGGTGGEPPSARGSEGSSEPNEVQRRVQPEMRRPKPSSDAIAAALEAAQRLAAEADAEEASEDAAQHLADHDLQDKDVPKNKDLQSDALLGDGSPDDDVAIVPCGVCGYRNRVTNRFCGMCGVVVQAGATEPETEAPGSLVQDRPRRQREISLHPNPFLDPEPRTEKPNSEIEIRATVQRRPPGNHRLSPEASPDAHEERHANGHPETHHYHHHYHHHYFPGGNEGITSAMGQGIGQGMGQSQGIVPRGASDPARDVERFRPIAALRGDMSRAEAAVRRIAHEWVLACNTKHLDDLLELYNADALVLRSNLPPIRGAAAVREFFFGALDSGLGEVELEPLRTEVMGELAYEAGRCKALVPSATGKRREERGKYLWVLTRQGGGEWRLAADCWSSDLTLTTLESDVPSGAAVRTTQPRKG